MVCLNHSETEATGACVYCGKLFCDNCIVDVNGKNYCKNCVGKAFNEQKNNNIPIINFTNANENVNFNNNINNNFTNNPESPCSRLVALLLCIFIGYLGIHRFYAGKIGTGLLYIFTFGLFGIGTLVDLIMIASGSFSDSRGRPIRNW